MCLLVRVLENGWGIIKVGPVTEIIFLLVICRHLASIITSLLSPGVPAKEYFSLFLPSFFEVRRTQLAACASFLRALSVCSFRDLTLECRPDQWHQSQADFWQDADFLHQVGTCTRWLLYLKTYFRAVVFHVSHHKDKSPLATPRKQGHCGWRALKRKTSTSHSKHPDFPVWH